MSSHAFDLLAAAAMMVQEGEGLGLEARTLLEASAMINAAAGSIIATLSFLGGFTLNSLPWFFSILAFVTAKGD